MAVILAKDLKLRISYETGVGEDGKPVLKTKSYANVSDSATPDQLQQVGQALASLSNYPTHALEKSELHEII